MITVTEQAKEELKAILVANGAAPEEGLRLLPTSDGNLVLTIDTMLSGDQVVEHEGYKVILIGIEYLKAFEGKTVDCEDTQDGTVLFVR